MQLEVVLHRLGADLRVGVGQAAELVVVVLEGVGVDRAEPHPQVLGVRRELAVVVDLVPRDVQRHARRQPGELVHLRGVGDLLLDAARCAGGAEHLEAGAGVAVGPGRDLDRELGEPVADVAEAGHVRLVLLAS